MFLVVMFSVLVLVVRLAGVGVCAWLDGCCLLVVCYLANGCLLFVVMLVFVLLGSIWF